MKSNVTFGCAIALLLVPGIRTASAQPAESRWALQISGIVQHNMQEWVNWYSIPPTVPPHIGWESAVNGIRGNSVGIDVAAERRVTQRVVLGVAVGFTPTKLETSVHRGTESGIVMATPDASIAYAPVRLIVNFEVLQRSAWSIRAGGHLGMAIFGSTDAHPEFGRSRHFTGAGSPLYGAQVGFVYSRPNGWGFSASVQHSRTKFRAEEIDTGDLPQTLDFHTMSVLVGVRRSLGRRR